MEGLGQIDGGLTAQGSNHALGLFKLEDVHDILGGQRLKVQLVGGGVVGGDRLGVVVDDDGLVASLADGHDRVDGGVVELHALPDADRACAQHHDLLLGGQAGVVFACIGGVEIGDIGSGVAGVHHAEDGEYVVRLAEVEHIQLGLLPHPGDVLVTEAHLLGVQQVFGVVHVELQNLLHVHNALDGLQEVGSDLGQLIDFVHGNTVVEQLGDGKNIVGTELADVFQHLVHGHIVEFGVIDVVLTAFQRADALQQSLFQIGADAHDLAGGLHLGAQLIGGRSELVEGEPGQLGNHIVQLRLKGGVGVGNLNILQRHAHGNFRGDPGDGVAGGLGSQSGTAGHPGVDLDEVVFRGIGVQGKLDVAAAFDFQLLDDLDGGVVEHLLILFAQRHDGSHHQRVAGVDTHGIDVLHAADGDGMVVGIPHDLELDLLVALDGLLHQHLMDRRQGEGVQADLHQFFFIIGKAAAGAAQGEGGPQNHGVANAQGRGLGFLDGVGDLGGDDRLADGQAHLLKQLPILRPLDGGAGGAQQLYPALLQDALLLQLHGKVQTGLTADAGDDGIGTLITDDFRDVFQRQRLHVHLIGDDGIRHDGSGVTVAQHHLVALFLQGQAGLGSRIVKLRRLTNDDGA